MKLFKNIEIAKRFHVSLNSVGSWIDKAQKGKNKLQLYYGNKKPSVIFTSENISILEELASKGRKYKNKDLIKNVIVDEEFYGIFDRDEVIDIINSIENIRELPHKYSFYHLGAKYWNSYVKKSLAKVNTVTNNIQLIEACQEFLLKRLQDTKQVNIIDIGVGNGLTIKKFLEHLNERKILRKYIGLDSSKELLNLTKNNINEWFKGKVEFEEHVIDFNTDNFGTITFSNTSLLTNDGSIKNIILFIGSILENQKNPSESLANIRKSMGKEDFLLIGQTLDNEKAKFNFDLSHEENAPVTSDVKKVTWILDLLNVKPEYYRFEKLYNSVQREREMRIILENDINIFFNINGVQKEVSLRKNESILLWRHRHNSYKEIVNSIIRNDLNILSTAVSLDKTNILIVCQINSVD